MLAGNESSFEFIFDLLMNPKLGYNLTQTQNYSLPVTIKLLNDRSKFHSQCLSPTQYAQTEPTSHYQP